MRLITPEGVRISVSDEKGEALLKKGYRRVEDDVPPPLADPKPSPRRKPRAK
jgi:hypothetical protein